MTRRLPQSTAYTIYFKMFLSSDHSTGATSKTVAITIMKAGATTFSNLAAGATNATECANGWYKFPLGTGDVDTLGDLVYRGTATSCDDFDDKDQVVNAFTGGLTALPGVVPAAVGGLLTAPTTANVGLSDLSRILGTALTETSGQIAAAFKKFFDKGTPTGTINSIPDAVAGASGGLFIAGANAATSITTALTANVIGNVTGNLSGSVGSVTGLTASNLDATISSRLASASYTAPLDAAGTRSAVGLASANLDTQLGMIAAYIDTEVGAIKAKTDNLPAAPAAVGDIPTANQNADALLDRSAAIETGVTPRGLFRIIGAVLGGKLSGGGTGTEVFRNMAADSKDRVTATDDSSGNRTAITLDMT